MAAGTLEALERNGRPVARSDAAGWPIHLFRLEDIGIEADAFLADVRPSFDRTAWDLYDVLNRQLNLMKRSGSASLRDEAERIDALPDAAERRAGVAALVETLDDELRGRAMSFEPHRRRAMRKYTLEHAGQDRWRIQPLADSLFRQAVTDYRAYAREFALMEESVSYHEGILALLAAVGETVRGYRPDARRIQTVLHQMVVTARPAQAANPAPEGVHQDGADFIVSALVVERRGVTGGVSRVREGLGGDPLLEVELAPGQGILQADSGTRLFHEVSAIELVGDSEAGHRMTFGVDVHVDAA